MPEGGAGPDPRPTAAPAALHDRLSLRLRVFLFFAALAAGALGALAFGLWAGYRHLADPAAAPGFVLAAAIAGFATLGLVTWVWYLFDEHVARAIARLAGGLRAEAHAGVEGALTPDAARYLGDLTPAARAVAGRLAETRSALAEAVGRETTRLAGEKARLEALLSDVPVGVLLCSASHQLVFYNGPATEMLGADAAVAPGLDRRIFDYLREAPLSHAHGRLLAAGDPEAVSDLMVATLDGKRILSGRMRLLGATEGGGPDAGSPASGGYVLTLRDVTADLAAHAGRERLLAEIFDRIRRPAANLLTVIGARAEAGKDARAPALDAAMQAEAAELARAVNELAARHDAARAGWWPLPMTRGADLIDGLRARIEARGLTLAATGADLILRCDGYAVVALIDALAGQMAATGLARAFTLDLAPDGAGAMISLGWTGRPLDVGALDRWLAEPLEVGAAEMTARAVLDNHATECWPEARPGGGALKLPILEARIAATRRPAPVARHVVYDFDLLFKARDDRIAEARLEDLTYVVFDTETTGLLPAEGDEIVQIAGLRIVNGRAVTGEVFDRLVNPGRSIPPRATEVHGISEAMVADAPGIAEVGRQFHHFAEGAVLVAHNAPFDMAFLRRHEAAIGRRFDHPILDTVLLSAVVWGQNETHSLDALGHRLGITIPEEARHTAIGDAVATAEALLRLIPILKGRGITRFGDVLTEVRKHGRLLKDLNA